LKKALEKQQTDTRPKRSRALTNLFRILALLLVIAITIFVYSIRDHVKEFAAYGYPGIFLVALMANATVFIPVSRSFSRWAIFSTR
jgi:hypothetical protein